VNNRSTTYFVRAELTGTTEATSFGGVRLFYRLRVSPAPAVATFADVPTTNGFFQFVEALAASGITGGCGGGNFCPDAPLTRGQMAVFLAAALGLHFPN
jgi:S-layer family protein